MRPKPFTSHTVLAFLFTTFCILQFGCKGNDGPVGPQGPPGQSLTGDMSGFVYLYDYNLRRLTDHSGVLIQLEGTQLQAITGTNGKWTLANVPAGTYTISFSKSGYGTEKVISYPFVGGGRTYLGEQSLQQVPLYYVANLTSISSGGSVSVSGNFVGTLPQSPFNRSAVLFLGRTSSVSSAPATYSGVTTANAYFDSLSFRTELDSSSFRYWGFQAGSTAYIAAYGGYTWGGYPDTATGRYYYTGLNPTRSNVVSVIVP